MHVFLSEHLAEEHDGLIDKRLIIAAGGRVEKVHTCHVAFTAAGGFEPGRRAHGEEPDRQATLVEPSERVLEEEGYEGGGAMVYFGWHDPFQPDLEDRIVALVKQLLTEQPLRLILPQTGQGRDDLPGLLLQASVAGVYGTYAAGRPQPLIHASRPLP